MALLRLFKENGKFRFGATITLLLIVLALLHQVIIDWRLGSGADPLKVGAYPIFQDPSSEHWLGTDRYGRDVLGLVLMGLPVSLTVAFFAGAVSTVVGAIVGFAAGYKGGKVDTVLRTITDMFIVIPTLPLIIILARYSNNLGSAELALILAAFSWPFAARIIRTQVLSLRERPYVELSKMTNMNDREIIFGDIFPNMAPYVAIGFASASVGSALALVGLTVLGLGPSNQMDLGRLIADALGWGVISLHKEIIFIAPVTLLILLFVGLAWMAQGMEEYFNPRLRSGS
ncbi:MAG TPA: ABC transporter permease [Thermomicrobiales bacterium]|nr:ABC transporter permease [Thermomicrobiales bacterium]